MTAKAAAADAGVVQSSGDDALPAILAWFATAAPAFVRFDGRRIGSSWINALHPREREICTGFAPSRQAEFATGRASLRSLLGDGTGDDAPILVGVRREPVLPPGIVATITHCDHIVLTAATSANRLTGLGIDVERTQRVTPDLAKTLLCASEQLTSAPDVTTLARYFTAKEAAFKAMHSHIGRYIEPEDVAVRFSGDRFIVEPQFDDPALRDTRLYGRCAAVGAYTVAFAVLSDRSHD